MRIWCCATGGIADDKEADVKQDHTTEAAIAAVAETALSPLKLQTKGSISPSELLLEVDKILKRGNKTYIVININATVILSYLGETLSSFKRNNSH